MKEITGDIDITAEREKERESYRGREGRET